MKRIVMLLLALTLATPLTANAGGIWSMIKNSDLEKREPVAFTLEVKGVNIRVYVFDVPEMQSICTSVWGSDNQQLECKTYKEIGEIKDNG